MTLSSQIFQQMYEHFPGYCFTKDLQSNFLTGNQHFLQLIGLNDNEKLAGKSDFNLPWAEQLATSYRNDDKLAIKDNHITVIEPVKTMQGTHQIVMTKKFMVQNDDNAPLLVGMATPLDLEIFEFFQDIKSKFDVARIMHNDVALSNKLASISHEPLTQRETEVYYYLLHGYSYRQIASILNLSNRTIEEYAAAVKSKFGCRHRSDLIAIAVEHKLMDILPKSVLLSIMHAGRKSKKS